MTIVLQTALVSAAILGCLTVFWDMWKDGDL